MLSKITLSAVRKFLYCPRWYYIQYILGFNPKTPLKAKFPIYDAIKGSILANNADYYRQRINGLIINETIKEEKAPFSEMVDRGALLLEKVLKWREKIPNINIIWKEQLAEYRIYISQEKHIYFPILSYPDLLFEDPVSKRKKLYAFRLGYVPFSEKEEYSSALKLYIYKHALEKHLKLKIDDIIILDMILRNRKNRTSNRTKTSVVEFNEIPFILDDGFTEVVETSLLGVAASIEADAYPASGMQTGVCAWCPYRASIKGKRFCYFTDEYLKKFAESSLQRANIEKWRNEF